MLKLWTIIRHYVDSEGTVSDVIGFNRTEARYRLAATLGNLWMHGAIIDEFGTNSDGEKIFVVNDDTPDAHIIWLEGMELPHHTVSVQKGMVN